MLLNVLLCGLALLLSNTTVQAQVESPGFEGSGNPNLLPGQNLY